ncbi:MAG: nucleoside hydrolase-like domain-containing protein [Bacteroidota bacterium]
MQELPVPKQRLLVLTDISNEPDDQQSLVRLLSYSNEYDLEGIVATTSTWLRKEVRPDIIKRVIGKYGKVRRQLLKHADGYPAAESLSAMVAEHLPEFGMAGVGPGKATAGTKLIIEAVDRSDERPLWIGVWGGANALAQVLWEVKEQRSSAEVAAFVDKLRVYSISDQDNAGPWIRENFPGIFYVVTPSPPNAGWYHVATWTGIAGDQHYQNAPFHRFELVDEPWLNEHVRQNHGPLGEEYEVTHYIMEGDTPSFLGLIRNGLGWPLSPAYGGWAGRYSFYQPPGDSQKIWSNNRASRDKVLAEDGNYYTSDPATIWRWRQDYQHDFAARMDWQIQPLTAANHNPKPVVNGSSGKSVLRLSAAPGDTLTFSAAKSTDPDNDQLSFEWFLYPEAGTYGGAGWSRDALRYLPWWEELTGPLTKEVTDQVILDQQKQAITNLYLPPMAEAGDIHLILRVVDNGTPSLTSYRRIIVEVSE